MKAEEVIRAVLTADFIKLMDEDSVNMLEESINRAEKEGKSRFIVRFLLQKDNPDGVPTPYYLWAAYPLQEGDEMELYPPLYENLLTYLDTPDELVGEPFFEVITPS